MVAYNLSAKQSDVILDGLNEKPIAGEAHAVQAQQGYLPTCNGFDDIQTDHADDVNLDVLEMIDLATGKSLSQIEVSTRLSSDILATGRENTVKTAKGTQVRLLSVQMALLSLLMGRRWQFVWLANAIPQVMIVNSGLKKRNISAWMLGMKHPVLVRVRAGDIDQQVFTVEAVFIPLEQSYRLAHGQSNALLHPCSYGRENW